MIGWIQGMMTDRSDCTTNNHRGFLCDSLGLSCVTITRGGTYCFGTEE